MGVTTTYGHLLCTMFFHLDTRRIHAWYIYLHLVDFYGKCSKIYRSSHGSIMGHEFRTFIPPRSTDQPCRLNGLSFLSKKSPTGPTERTPKPEYLIARLQLTEQGPLGFGPIQVLMDFGITYLVGKISRSNFKTFFVRLDTILPWTHGSHMYGGPTLLPT